MADGGGGFSGHRHLPPWRYMAAMAAAMEICPKKINFFFLIHGDFGLIQSDFGLLSSI